MKLYKKIIVVCSLCLIAFIALIFIILSNISKPTTGSTIAKYKNPQKALLVIDTQEEFIGTNGKMKNTYKDVPAFIDRINYIQRQAVLRNFKIIYIKQEYSSLSGRLISALFLKNGALKGSQGTNVDKRIIKYSNLEFTKSIGDAFINKKLTEYLIANQINELYLCGLDGEHCVYFTSLGAKNRNYKVNIFADGILITNPSHLNALLQKFYDHGYGVYNRSFHKMNSK